MKNQHVNVARIIALSSLALLLIGGCQNKVDADSQKTGASFNYESSVGWMQGPCLAIENDNLKSGTRLALVLFKEKLSLGEAVVESKTDKNCPALNPDRAGINRKKGTTFYAVKSGDIEANTIAVAFVTNRKISTITPVSPTSAKLDVNGNGHTEEVSNCVTSEGIKFSIWPEKAYKGKPLWESYYYLGYDLQPTCPSK